MAITSVTASVNSVLAGKIAPNAQNEPTIVLIEKNDATYDPAKKLRENAILSLIAQCESGSRQYNEDGGVIRGVVNPQDIGILQINLDYHGERARELGYDLFTLEGNIEYGLLLYEEQGTTPWNPSRACWEKGAS